jgi:hypothetical protein
MEKDLSRRDILLATAGVASVAILGGSAAAADQQSQTVGPDIEKALEFEKERAKRLKSLLDEIERRRKEVKKGWNFTAPTEEQLRKKLSSTKSPMIAWQSWSGSVPAGGTLNYSLGIHNPDPTGHIWLFVHVFIGPATVVSDIGPASTAVDPRFPRLAMPKFDGLSIDPGGNKSLDFAIKIPPGVEPSNYLGNSFLFQSNWHALAQNFDRSNFVFEVT